MELPFELSFGLIAGQTYWWLCELMGEFIGNNLGVLSANRMPLLGELCGCLPLRPLTSRHICDMPVRWSHLSTADCHLVRLSVGCLPPPVFESVCLNR